MDFARLSKPQRVSAIAIGVVALAAFLPWASVFGVSVIGIEGDGVITLVLAVVGAAVLAVTTGVVGGQRTPGKASRIILLIFAAIVAIVGLGDMNNFAAMGLYLTMFAGFAWVVGAVWELRSAKAPAPATQEPSPDQTV